MLIGAADVRRLMEADDPPAALVIYQGRAAVIPAGDPTAGRYPGPLSITSQQAVLDILGRHVTSEQDIEQLAANLDSIAAVLWPGNWRFALAGTNYFAQGGTPSPLQHTWSLAVEEHFYLLWPLFLLVCRAVTRWRLLGLSLAEMAASALVTYILAGAASTE